MNESPAAPVDLAPSHTPVAPPPKAWTRLLQFRFRTLLLLVTIASIASWWFLYQPGLTQHNIERLQPILVMPKEAWQVDWTKDRRRVAFTPFEGQVEFYDARTMQKLRVFAPGKKVIHFSFSPQPDVYAYCENNTTVVIVDEANHTERSITTPNWQPNIAFSPDGRLLASGGDGKIAYVWDVATGRLRHRLPVTIRGGLTTMFSPDGKQIAVGSRNGDVRIFSAATGALLHALPGNWVQDVAYDPSGQLLAVAYADGVLRVWDAQAGTLIRTSKPTAEDLYRVDWSPDGDMLVTCGLNGKITVWQPNLAILCQRDAPEWVIDASFSPDGSRIITTGGSATNRATGKVTIWGVRPRVLPEGW